MGDLLSIAKSGLFASKKALETTGHNISNANTEGYSRQRIQQQAATPLIRQGHIQGTGTWIKGINRIHDPFVEKRLDATHSQTNYFKERAEELSQVEDIFNEVDGDGLNKILNKFYNSFRELANQPEDQTLRSVVRDNAKLAVRDFKRIVETLDQISKNIDRRIETAVVDINDLTDNISRLNKQIAALEATGSETGDLRDQRDLAVKNLSEQLRVETYLDDRGNFIVNAKGMGTLVSGGSSLKLISSNVAYDLSTSGSPPSREIFFEGRPGIPITDKIQGGKVAAAIAVRNEDIRDLHEQVDNVAFEFTNTVNAVHKRGYINRQAPILSDGRTLASDRAYTGIGFFKDISEVKNAAQMMDLSDEVKTDLNNIVSALNPNSPGDNRVALAISKLQHEKILDGGTTTLEEYYLKIVGKVGLEVGKSNFDRQQSEGILAQLQSIKERTSGVSIDEETANMVQYQHAYDAAAKVIKTADEMFDTVINLKR